MTSLPLTNCPGVSKETGSKAVATPAPRTIPEPGTLQIHHLHVRLMTFNMFFFFTDEDIFSTASNVKPTVVNDDEDIFASPPSQRANDGTPHISSLFQMNNPFS